MEPFLEQKKNGIRHKRTKGEQLSKRTDREQEKGHYPPPPIDSIIWGYLSIFFLFSILFLFQFLYNELHLKGGKYAENVSKAKGL